MSHIIPSDSQFEVGNQMDMFIAERVLGWTDISIENIYSMDPPMGKPSFSTTAFKIPPYSIIPASALNLLMSGVFDFFVVDWQRDEKNFYCRIGLKGNNSSSTASTMPEAVCRAVINAFRVCHARGIAVTEYRGGLDIRMNK